MTDDRMPVLSLDQPFAEFVRLGIKTVESRSWPTKHRGDFVVHSTKRVQPPRVLSRLFDDAAELLAPITDDSNDDFAPTRVVACFNAAGYLVAVDSPLNADNWLQTKPAVVVPLILFNRLAAANSLPDIRLRIAGDQPRIEAELRAALGKPPLDRA